MKICKKCNLEKSISLFCINKQSKDGLDYYCRDCKRKKKKTWIIKNSIKISDYNKQYYVQNKNKESSRNKLYYENNKLKINKKRNEYFKERKTLDLSFKISCNLRNRLLKAIKRNQKYGSAIKDLGCSIEFLKEYLEDMFYHNSITGEVMTWENYGKGWEIDHINPFCSFDLSKCEDILQVCHYTNLQPLWKDDHISKTTKDIKLKK